MVAEIALSAVLAAVGIFLIVKGSDFFVDAAIKLSRSLGVSELIIGATVVSIGTTLPELVTGLTAIIMARLSGDAGMTEIAIGNSFGSMCCNLGLVLAVAMIFGSVKADRRIYGKAAILAIATLAAAAILFIGKLTVLHGVALLIIFAAFIAESIFSGRRETVKLKETVKTSGKDKLFIALGLIFGAVSVGGGAYITVENIEKICVACAIPSQIIGATVIAVGTSLPELATTISAIRKGSADIGLGNVIGANIVNATLLLGLVAIASGGIDVDPFTGNIGVYFLLAITAVAIIPTVIKKRAYRLQGVALTLLYIGLIIADTLYSIK